MEACIRGGDSRCGRSEAEVEAAEMIKVEAVETEVVEAKAAKAAEAEGCIGGGSMHWKHQRRRHALEALECIGSARRRMELTELMELAVNTKCRRR
jgi:hypothetical protein